MLLIPAIDLKDGKCVRLKQGRMEDDTVFSDDPVAVASHWVERGARRLHLVDLNGAFAGEPVNGDIVRVHFTGMTKTGLRNGSSRGVGKGTPPTFKGGEGAIMKALDEVVKQMSAGETAKFECPEDLAVNAESTTIDSVRQRGTKGGDVILDVQLFSVNGSPKTRWD